MVDSRSTGASFDTKADAPASKNALLDVRIVHGREHDDFHLRVQRVIWRHASSPWTFGRLQVEHNHVRLESLRGLQQCTAVRDGSHDFAVQRQQPADGFHHARVVVRKQHAGAWSATLASDSCGSSGGP